RRPDREGDARDAVDDARVRAELRVDLLVAALAREVEVDLAERRQERVRIAQAERVAVRVADLELVAERKLRPLDESLDDPRRVVGRELDAHRLDPDGRGLGPVGADDHAALGRMGAEEAVRAREVEPHAASGCSISRRIPATGIRAQSGRLFSSYRSS